MSNQLSLCVSYYNNSPDNYNVEIIDTINWDFIYNHQSDSYFNHSKVLYLLSTSYTLNPPSVFKFIHYKGKNLIKKVFLFSDKADRKRLLRFTKGHSIHKELYKYKKVIEELEKDVLNKYKLFRKVLFNDFQYYGKIFIDDGAIKAINKPWLNVLAVGIIRVEGQFEAGQIVGIFDSTNNLKFIGVSEYSSEDLCKIIGHQSKEFFEILDYNHTSSIIKADFRRSVKYDHKKWNYETKISSKVSGKNI